MRRTRPRSRGGGGGGRGRRDSLSRRLHSAAQGFSTRPLGLDTLDRKLASSLQFPGDDGNLARAHASAERTNKCLRMSPDSWPRSPGTRCPVRVASSPASRGSPAPRSSPGHPSERREGRWCGARGTGARSEPWRPPPAGREERGVERTDPARGGVDPHREAAEQRRVGGQRTQRSRLSLCRPRLLKRPA